MFFYLILLLLLAGKHDHSFTWDHNGISRSEFQVAADTSAQDDVVITGCQCLHARSVLPESENHDLISGRDGGKSAGHRNSLEQGGSAFERIFARSHDFAQHEQTVTVD